MKTNELRIGNYYHWNADGKNYSLRVTKDDFKNDNHLNFKPIPLTEEFKEKIGKDKLVLVDKLGFVIFKNGYAYQFVFEDYPYIHLIQNLYFSLTNEELQINHEQKQL